MRILLTGGGTGGHIIPIIALVSKIKEYFKKTNQKVEFLWLGSKQGLEKKIIDKEKITFKEISSGKFRRYWSSENFFDIFRLIYGFFQSIYIIKKFKPDILFSKGGYVSVPVVLAASLFKVPSIIHESDISLGLANKISLPWVKKIAITFEETKKDIKEKYKDKVIITGNPVREDILRGDRSRGFKNFKLKNDKPVIFVLGGSQGAMMINEIVVRSLSQLLEKYQIIHLCGEKNYRGVGSLLTIVKLGKNDGDYHLFSSLYGEELADAFSCADLVISRGGLNTLFELALLAKPSIIIPYPYAAGNHQEKNANKIAKEGAIKLIKEKDLDSNKLIEQVENLFENKEELKILSRKIYEFGKKVNKNASQKIMDELLKLNKEENIKDVVKNYVLDSSGDNLDLEKIRKVYFIGIGGIGMSAVARISKSQSKEVFGSDLVASIITQDLEKIGIKVMIGEHRSEDITKDVDLVVYSNAVRSDNVEIVQAKKYNIPILSYPRLLGLMTWDKFTICITGTHGKTTTTSLVSVLLEKAGFDPTCVVGSNLKEFRGNARLGNSKYFVLEADEYRAAFLNYNPNIIILNNIEMDHPDFYKDLEDVKAKFKQFVQKLPKNGLLVANFDDKNVLEVAKNVSCRVVTFGLKDGADFQAYNIRQEGINILYNIKCRKQDLGTIKLKLVGRHNVYNSLATIVLSQALKIPLNEAKETIEGYTGAWRRFELKGEQGGVVVIDDYAHHPTEIRTTLAGARMKYQNERIIAVFQPHHQDRFEALFDDFVRSFNSADLVVLTDIYHVAGREERMTNDQRSMIKKDIKLLKEKIGKKAIYTGSLDNTLQWLISNVKEEDLVITLGAGDVTEIAGKLINKLKFKY